MKNLFIISMLALAIIFLDSCSSTPVGTCNASNTAYQLLYNNLANDTVRYKDDSFTMDLDTHAYKFTVATNMTLCEVGYRAHPAMASTPYLIKIRNITTGATVFSQNLIFSTTATSFFNVGTPIVLNAGDTYEILRATPNTVPLGDVLGRVVRSRTGSLTFPVNYANLYIQSSRFEGRGGPINNWGIPYIIMVLN